jgi:hypothetical protein
MDAQMEKSAMLLNVAVEDFLRYCAIERQLSQHTVEAYANDLSDFCRFCRLGRPSAQYPRLNLPNTWPIYWIAGNLPLLRYVVALLACEHLTEDL